MYRVSSIYDKICGIARGEGGGGSVSILQCESHLSETSIFVVFGNRRIRFTSINFTAKNGWTFAGHLLDICLLTNFTKIL